MANNYAHREICDILVENGAIIETIHVTERVYHFYLDYRINNPSEDLIKRLNLDFYYNSEEDNFSWTPMNQVKYIDDVSIISIFAGLLLISEFNGLTNHF